MAEDGRRFEETMDALEAQREDVEAEFHALLEGLSRSIDGLRAAMADLVARQSAQAEARREALDAGDPPFPQVGSEETTWPTSGGGARGRVNRFARWLLRDYLMVLDRRQTAERRRLEGLELRVDRLRATVDEDAALVGTVEATLACVHEALQTALEAQGQMLALVNAKDAEVLQRAVAGPLRRMEVLFDEFGRQQETLLSQLVGRRAELDELVRAVTPAPGDEM